jgi:hypothetical protein
VRKAMFCVEYFLNLVSGAIEAAKAKKSTNHI